MKTYCPCCGEWSEKLSNTNMVPGECIWKCPVCETTFTIRIEFIPQEETQDESLARPTPPGRNSRDDDAVP